MTPAKWLAIAGIVALVVIIALGVSRLGRMTEVSVIGDGSLMGATIRVDHIWVAQIRHAEVARSATVVRSGDTVDAGRIQLGDTLVAEGGRLVGATYQAVKARSLHSIHVEYADGKKLDIACKDREYLNVWIGDHGATVV